MTGGYSRLLSQGAMFIDRLGPKYTMMTGFLCQSIVGFGMSAGYANLKKHVGGFAVTYGIYLSFGEFGPGNCLGVLASKATGPTGQSHLVFLGFRTEQDFFSAVRGIFCP